MGKQIFNLHWFTSHVVGWNWHQRQQRGVANPVWVQDRVNEVNEFYSTSDVEEAVAFLKKYHVKYIVVGQMEDIIYPLTWNGEIL